MQPVSQSRNAGVSNAAAMAAVEGKSVAARMADAMLESYAEKQVCGLHDLRRAGFTDAEIDAHGDAAAAIAKERFVRDDGGSLIGIKSKDGGGYLPVRKNATERAKDERAQAAAAVEKDPKVMRMRAAADCILAIMPDPLMITQHLQSRGFTKEDIDDFGIEAMNAAAELFAQKGGAL